MIYLSPPLTVGVKRLLLHALTVGLTATSVLSAHAESDPELQAPVVQLAPGGAYQPATRKFEGIPGLACTQNGKLFATWYSGGEDEGPDNYVLLVTSEDHGKTWSAPVAVIDPPDPIRAFDPVVWVDPQRRLWWFFAQSKGGWDGRGGVWASVLESPDNQVQQWSVPRRIADGVMMNKPTVLSDGQWMFPIASWAHGRKPRPDSEMEMNGPREIAPAGTHIYGSSDQGNTFQRIGTAAIPDVRYDEHMLVELHNKRLWLLARTHAGISESHSDDGGRNWSAGVPSSIPNAPSRFFIRKLQSQHLLLVKHNPPIDNEWLRQDIIPSWRKRSHLTAYLSLDDGATWKGGLSLDSRLVVSYPDGDQGADGRIYLVHDYNRKTDREIVLSVFVEEDILAGAIVNQNSHLRRVINRTSYP